MGILPGLSRMSWAIRRYLQITCAFINDGVYMLVVTFWLNNTLQIGARLKASGKQRKKDTLLSSYGTLVMFRTGNIMIQDIGVRVMLVASGHRIT
jgi:hypothetical protein